MLPDGLNTIYAHFDLLHKGSAFKFSLLPEDRQLSVTTGDVRKICADNIPDYVPERQLILLDIFIISLSQETAPTCFKTAL